jgi:hypothetical protein
MEVVERRVQQAREETETLKKDYYRLIGDMQIRDSASKTQLREQADQLEVSKSCLRSPV